MARRRQAYYRNRDTIMDIAEDRVIEQIIESEGFDIRRRNPGVN